MLLNNNLASKAMQKLQSSGEYTVKVTNKA